MFNPDEVPPGPRLLTQPQSAPMVPPSDQSEAVEEMEQSAENGRGNRLIKERYKKLIASAIIIGIVIALMVIIFW